MKYRFFTAVGDSFPIAYKLQQDGHDVFVGIVDDLRDVHAKSEGTIPEEDPVFKKRRLSLYDGMIEKRSAKKLIDELKNEGHPEDYFVFFDRNNLFFYAKQIAHLPYHGNFPTEQDYLFEQDRESGKAFVRKHYPKLHVADVKTFAQTESGLAFLRETESLWVLKGNDDSTKTFVPDVDDPALAARQIMQALQDNREAYDRSGYILEELIYPVIELTPEKIYYDGEPLAVVMDIENKPFGSGNISVQTGCSQDLVFPISMDSKIAKIAFPPIVDELARQHKGLFIWDASLLIDRRSGKMYFGEFCSNRPGYNCLFSELAQADSINDFFVSLAAKKSPFTLGTVGCSVLLLNMAQDEQYAGHTVPGARIDYKPEIEPNVWLWDVRRDNNHKVTVGDDWNLAVITGAGKSIDEAVQGMYKSVDAFSFAGAYYRPKSDFLSLEYATSILNRLNYGLEKKLYQIPFDVKVATMRA